MQQVRPSWSNFTFLYVTTLFLQLLFSVLCCDIIVWEVPAQKNNYKGKKKTNVLVQNTWFCCLKPAWKTLRHPLKNIQSQRITEVVSAHPLETPSTKCQSNHGQQPPVCPSVSVLSLFLCRRRRRRLLRSSPVRLRGDRSIISHHLTTFLVTSADT